MLPTTTRKAITSISHMLFSIIVFQFISEELLDSRCVNLFCRGHFAFCRKLKKLWRKSITTSMSNLVSLSQENNVIKENRFAEPLEKNKQIIRLVLPVS